ncbi:hypothetical protein [Neomicrococcus lactis]|uniref:hypothetical protein n=1 Tax=Neomicrococcus lactis TaxID=732241 RepID=UPI002301D1F4|nr:hypothetical protein [Neomicrococcus lactis]
MKPVNLIVFVVVAALIAGGAFFAGWWLRPAEQVVLQNIPQSVPVMATAQDRKLGGQTLAVGQVQAGRSLSITAPAGLELPHVVTRVALAKGDQVTGSSFIGTVNDQPRFILATSIPLYRNIRIGDRGSDVAALLKSFDLPKGNVATWRLLHAVRKLYVAQKLEGPKTASGEPMLKRDHFVSADPEFAGTVETVAKPGEVLPDSGALAVISLGKDRGVFRLDVLQVESLKVGDKVDLTISGQAAKGVISAISEFSAGSGDQIAGKNVTVELSSIPSGVAISRGQSIEWITPRDSAAVLTVPLTSLKQDEEGDFVTVALSASEQRKVHVAVTKTQDGYAVVEPTDELKDGTALVLE